MLSPQHPKHPAEHPNSCNGLPIDLNVPTSVALKVQRLWQRCRREKEGGGRQNKKKRGAEASGQRPAAR